MIRSPVCPASPASSASNGQDGIRHSVEVNAERLFEAAAEAAGLLQKNDWTAPIGGPGSGFRWKSRPSSTK
jgi:hypothetical protein